MSIVSNQCRDGGMRVGGALLAILLSLAALLAVPSPAPAAATTPTYYVSLGDSYAVGYQPGLGATPGYMTYVAQKTHFTLVNFGCGGATTTSLLTVVGCPVNLPHTAGAVPYPTTTQAAAAEAFLRNHRGHIGLITVSIGGNDVTSCAANSNPITCVAGATTTISKNVSSLAAALRTAAGPRVPLIGLTYPDVILGAYVYPTQPPSATRITLAKLSVVAFRSLINPTLTKAYGSVGGVLVDVTAATGAYTSLTRTARLAPYGTIPVPVASVCTLTWFCSRGDIHAKTRGYMLIGRLVVAKLATMRQP
jgi:lysophospholipase L1-like esterase